MTSDRDREIFRLRDAGAAYAAIAAELGISTAVAHKVVRRSGRETRTIAPWTPERDAELAERFARGDSGAELCAAFGLSSSSIYDRVKHLRLKREIPKLKRHGRPACWKTGCDHPVCVAARTEYKRAERAAARERGPASHGLAGYSRGCDCDICQQAHHDAMRARQVRTRKTAIAHGERWSDEEDAAIRDTTRRIEDIAADIGRTYSAIDNRRRYLDKRAAALANASLVTDDEPTAE